jgi:hypothetical protein
MIHCTYIRVRKERLRSWGWGGRLCPVSPYYDFIGVDGECDDGDNDDENLFLQRSRARI